MPRGKGTWTKRASQGQTCRRKMPAGHHPAVQAPPPGCTQSTRNAVNKEKQLCASTDHHTCRCLSLPKPVSTKTSLYRNQCSASAGCLGGLLTCFLGFRIASKAAMKKVLSPISEWQPTNVSQYSPRVAPTRSHQDKQCA